MKKRKILYLFPLAALILSGCTFEEVMDNTKSFFGNNIVQPIKDLFDKITGKKKDEQKPSDGDQKDDQGGVVPGEGEQEETIHGSQENPLSISEFMTELDKLVEAPESGTLTDRNNVFFIKGKVTSNTAANDTYQISHINMVDPDDKTKEIVAYYAELADDLGQYTAANSLAGAEIVVKGYGAKFIDKSGKLVYEITDKSKNEGPAIILSAKFPEPDPDDNYGTLENPISISDAIALIKKNSPTPKEIYVTGVVKSNTEWNDQFGNVDITLADDTAEFLVWRASKLPNDLHPKADELEGKVIVAHGKGKVYGSTYELDSGCTVDSISDPVKVDVESVSLSSDKVDMEVGDHVSLEAFVYPNEANQEVEWNIEQDADIVSFENNVITGLAVGTATITATSVENPDAKASCVVTVTEATKILTGIEIDTTNAKTEYTVGDDYSEEGLVVTAHYSNAADEDVTAFVEWTIDPESATEEGEASVSFTASYNNEETTVVVAVTVILEKGTLEHPYSVSEAYEIFQDLGSNQDNGKSVYVEGYINSQPAPTINNKRGSFYLTDGVCQVDLYAYGLNNVGNSQDMTLEDLPVGGKAVVQGAIKNYNDGFQICYVKDVSNGCLAKAVEAPVISGVGTVTGPAEVALNGEVDPSKVTVEVIYSGIVESTVTASSATGDFTKEGTATVTITIEGWESTLSFEIEVVSTVQPTEQVYKSVAFAAENTKDSISSYTATGTYTQNGFSVGIENFNNNKLAWDFIKCGRKSDPSVAKITTSSAIDKAVTKASIEFDSFTQKEGSSAKLLVSSNADMSDATEYALQPVANSTVSIDLGSGAANMYYQFYFDCVAHGSSNGYIVVKSVSFSAIY